MKIWGINRDQAQEALETANLDFEGNLSWNRLPEEFGKKITGVNCTIRVEDSSGSGARMSASGRKSVSATYEAHYRFMEEVMTTNPQARIKTAMEDYRGIGEFYAKAGAVAGINVGSMMCPARFGDL